MVVLTDCVALKPLRRSFFFVSCFGFGSTFLACNGPASLEGDAIGLNLVGTSITPLEASNTLSVSLLLVCSLGVLLVFFCWCVSDHRPLLYTSCTLSPPPPPCNLNFSVWCPPFQSCVRALLARMFCFVVFVLAWHCMAWRGHWHDGVI